MLAICKNRPHKAGDPDVKKIDRTISGERLKTRWVFRLAGPAGFDNLKIGRSASQFFPVSRSGASKNWRGWQEAQNSEDSAVLPRLKLKI